MHITTIEVETNEAILKLIDKKFDCFLIHQFQPSYTYEWMHADLKVMRKDFKNIEVRSMRFDMQTNLEGLTQLFDMNIRNINVYQFDKKIAGDLILENLPEKAKDKILQQNGLQHKYVLNYEFLTVSSFDKEFIDAIDHCE
jgi:hypothetical protein